jgi:hypothetical protein
MVPSVLPYYVDETKSLYKSTLGSAQARDGDIVLNDSTGGTTSKLIAINRPVNKNNTGWIDLGAGVLSQFDATTVRFSTVTLGVFACAGVRYELTPATNFDCIISGAAGIKHLYFSKANLTTLAFKDAELNFDLETPVAIAFWNGSAITGLATEYHTCGRNIQWHLWAHKAIGPLYKDGLTPTTNVVASSPVDPAVDTVQYLWITAGTIVDEDIEIKCGTGQWLQTLGSGLTSATAAIIPFWYFDGTNVVPNAAMADRCPFIYSGANGTPMWNNAGSMTASVTDDYIVYHYFATNMIGGQAIYARPHNAKFEKLALATAAKPSSLTWEADVGEIKHLYSAVFRVNTGWAGVTHRCKLVSFQDFRLVAGTPAAGVTATSHASLSNLFQAASGIAYGHVDDGAQTIAGAKTFSGAFKASAGFTLAYRSMTATGAILTTDLYVDLDHAATAVEATLPTAASVAGKTFVLTRVNLATVRILCTGVETINGSAFLDLPNMYSSVSIHSNGTNWIIH